MLLGYICTMGIVKGLNFGCYPGYCLFAYGLTFDEIMDTLSTEEYSSDWKQGIEAERDFYNTCNCVASKRTVNGRDYFYIFITEEMELTDYDYCKIAHEVLHICQFFLRDVLNRDVEIEAEAYFHTHLMEQVLEGIRENNLISSEKTKDDTKII